MKIESEESEEEDEEAADSGIEDDEDSEADEGMLLKRMASLPIGYNLVQYDNIS